MARIDGGGLPKELNRTLLVLIPKTKNRTCMKFYHPISLCPMVYKTITKLVANRLKEILPTLIGPTHTSFVSGRHIVENVVVAQEIIHWMKKKTGKIEQMTIKEDLEKAYYDRLRWDFIHNSLLEVGLPASIVCLIMNCVTSPTMQLLWNGELTESFTPSRGIRRGVHYHFIFLCSVWSVLVMGSILQQARDIGDLLD